MYVAQSLGIISDHFENQICFFKTQTQYGAQNLENISDHFENQLNSIETDDCGAQNFDEFPTILKITTTMRILSQKCCAQF